MKKFFITIAIIVITMINFGLNAQNVGIGSSNFTPDPSAGLEIKCTNKGLLIPRVVLTSATDQTTIPSPATSLLVYNLGTGGLTPAGYYYWDGSQWVKFATGSSIINGNGTATQVAFWSGTNTLSSDAGLYWDNSNKRLGIGTNAPTTMLEINGPVALVTVTDNPANSNWKGSSMLKIYFSADDVSANIQTINDDSFKVESHRIAKFFERLMPCAVKIPFMNDIFTKMKDAGLPITENLVKPLTNLISLLTIINNPHPVWEDEIIASIYGVDRNQLRNWLTTKGYDVEAIPVNINSAKTATKVEYHLASLLLNGRLEADNEILTERQLRIFSAIKRWNIGRLGSTFADMDNKVEKLSTIARNANSWADRETVFDQVNKDEQDIISLSTINNELQVLMDMDIVQRQKVPKDNKYGYFILTLDAGKTIMLPHASEIADSIFKGEKVQVVNPLTGQIEII